MNTIYFNNKKLHILSETEILPPNCEDYICVDILFPVNLLETIELFNSDEYITPGAFTIAKPEEVFEILRLKYKPVFAAGGLIINDNSNLLLIYRNGKWDLPKGKIDKNEETQDAAKREVLEETGLKVSEDVTELAITFHTYKMKGKDCLKRTDWYLMFANENQNLIPQSEEGITEIRWIQLEDFEALKELSYPAITDVIDAYSKMISISSEQSLEEETD